MDNTKRFSEVEILAGAVAHGLRNPLAAIKLAVYNMKRKKTGLEEDRHLLNIDKKIEESENLINSLLLYSQSRLLHFDEIDIHEILLESIAFLKGNLKKDRLKVSEKKRYHEDALTEADPLQIKEMFGHILKNAYDAVSENEGKIEIIAEYADNEFITIHFKDAGSGIDDADLPRIFEPFFTTKPKGIGLGLSMSRQIIELHQGKINITSKKGEGTTVTVILPKRKPNDAATFRVSSGDEKLRS